MTDIIAKKRDGMELNLEEIRYFVKSATDFKIPDYQISAMLMAIYLNGMTDSEIANFTAEMANSGEV